MIERVADAIMKALETEGVYVGGERDRCMVDGGLFDMRVVSRAAIEAMREHEMVYRDQGQIVHELRGAPNDIWQAMIDAALTPPE